MMTLRVMMMMMMLLYLSDLFDGLKGIKEGGEEVWKDCQEVDDVHEAFYELPPEPMMKMFYMNSFHDKADNIDGHEDDDDEDEQ